MSASSSVSSSIGVLLLLVLIELQQFLVSSLAQEGEAIQENEIDNTCTVYMAPSSLPDVDGFGLYTVKDLKQNTNILNGPDGPSIPVVDYHYTDDEEQYGHNWIHLFDSYWWGRGVWDFMKYEADIVADFQIMFGSLPNHHCILQALEHRNPAKPYDTGVTPEDTGTVQGKLHPGAGAYSYYRGKEFFVHRDVQAGEELFLNYGKCAQRREEPGDAEEQAYDWRDGVLKPSDVDVAGRIAERMWHHLQAFQQENGHVEGKPDVFDEIVVEVKDEVLDVNEWAASVLPPTYNDLQTIANMTPSFQGTELAIYLAREYGTTKRSVDWIRENGLCMDNIVPGPSTLPQAGQGAIAQRAVPKGEIVVPVPMLHILNKNVLKLYRSDGGETDQLLLNYCFGHNQSSLLLCPLSNAILVNHCSNRTIVGACKDGPNAKYRWSSGWDLNINKWLGMSLEEIANETARGLSFEIVATRDIEPGDEIFLDYGAAWEEAWENHVANWSPPVDAGPSAAALNDKRGPIVKDLISGDLRKKVDHPTIFTGCRFWTSEYDEEWRMADPHWKKREDDVLLKRYATSTGNYYVVDHGVPEMDGSYWPCTVIRSDSKDDSTYTVRILQSTFHPKTEWHIQYLPRFITKYPRSSIRYFHEPYTSDMHLHGVFRHAIDIRDDIFPEHWKNLKDANSTKDTENWSTAN